MRPKIHELFDQQLEQLLDQKASPIHTFPNVQQVEGEKALRLIAQCHGKVYQPYSIKLGERHVIWHAKVFTHRAGMAGRFDGMGVILASDGKAYRFHMCEHTWDTSGANHQRGWHPQWCTKCGFDASIDSGD